MAPFDAWLLLRGLKTLAVRMDRHCDNAEKIVSFLRKHDAVEGVWYPEGVSISSNETRGRCYFFSVKGGKKRRKRLLISSLYYNCGEFRRYRNVNSASSNDDARAIPAELRKEMGIFDNLIRLSVGLESWEDIVSDLEQALKKISTVNQ